MNQWCGYHLKFEITILLVNYQIWVTTIFFFDPEWGSFILFLSFVFFSAGTYSVSFDIFSPILTYWISRCLCLFYHTPSLLHQIQPYIHHWSKNEHYIFLMISLLRKSDIPDDEETVQIKQLNSRGIFYHFILVANWITVLYLLTTPYPK